MNSIATLTANNTTNTHKGLAGIDTDTLCKMRKAGLRQCFARMEDTRYRMEFVARIRGREYINDAASRSINATWYALESETGKLIWIVDAYDPDANYTRLVDAANRKVQALLIVGVDDSALRTFFTDTIPEIAWFANMQEALHHAYYHPNEELKVIYSPASPNGMTATEAGELFNREVNEL
ncbi:MAG: hypothetical protein IJ761_03870 [Bacteroidales bacterium]|nr:hypothetical protein [Bacteroidales bacterium]